MSLRQAIRLFLTLLLALSALGCGQEAHTTFSEVGSALPSGATKSALPAPPGVAAVEQLAMRQAGEADQNKGGENGEPNQAPAEVARKIIYTASLSVVVEQFETAQQQLQQLLHEQKDSYVAKADLHGSPGSPRSGTWTVRIPVEQFDSFREAVGKLGELIHSTTDSQDVTDQYYDSDAHLKNKRVEEERLLKHLDKSTGKLEDILAVERELTRVRGEVERLQGRLNYLSKMSALTTITISLQERTGYKPAATPSFGSRLGWSLSDSLQRLLDVGQALIVASVILAPWFGMLGVIIGPFWVIARRRRTV